MAKRGFSPENGTGKGPLFLPSGLPDGEPKGEFRVRVEQPLLVYSALKKGEGGIIAHNLYEYPVEEIEVELIPGSGRFHIKVRLNPEFSEETKINFTKLLRALEATYSVRYVGPNKAYAIFRVGRSHSSPGTEFIMDPTVFEGITISTGLISDAGGQDIEKVTAPVVNKETVSRVLSDTAEMIEFVVRTAYLSTGQIPPNEELVIRPPKARESAANVRDLLKEREPLRLADVGGNREAKQSLADLVLALKHPEKWEQWGTKPPKGILFVGPPGTGKTMMVEAVANEIDARFVRISSSDVYEMWVGSSGRNMQKIFDEARKHKGKTVLFIDELDAMFGQRKGSHEVTRQVLNVFLQNTSGLDDNPRLTLMAATNQYDEIDPAILRSGRFDLIIEVPLPDDEARREIFKVHMGRAEVRAKRQLFRRLQWAEVLAKTKGWSGADIETLLLRILGKKARREAVTEKPSSLVTHKELMAEIATFMPNISRPTVGFVKEGAGQQVAQRRRESAR